ncbi:type 1 periplasmic binding fold superfamily protein [Flavilitoribacter nigricans]|uniref:Type 1 periplasmic binding fold superfamily protein n=1 Tax=Flavilitoribacter nigricans (strain ATCC 23147 / DSM 23189 / NBRC 102662 / NCIMB 1420 / SS-2) TaxID=1122177 RepID=A0A2D0N4E7_FLAN2|nr:type 1 periplasmic binding fold superfamily protein [Flavilitoribacter nigricans]PHN02643.1 type 1 periplasmic binding fold superfamily protein [Flavilitoribacter nigricans DSM 23189 = NBRC 102662]
MNQILKFFTLGFIAFSLIGITACQKDDDDMTDPGNEQEVITTVQLEFTPELGGDVLTFVFSDPDGPGGQAPAVDNIELAANTTYEVTVEFIDNSGSTPVFITDEVQEEAEEHLVCYEVTGDLSPLTIKDQDMNGDALGLIATMMTGDAGSGDLTVSLKHEPVKDSATPCSTGETDVEATFQVTVN